MSNETPSILDRGRPKKRLLRVLVITLAIGGSTLEIVGVATPYSFLFVLGIAAFAVSIPLLIINITKEAEEAKKQANK